MMDRWFFIGLIVFAIIVSSFGGGVLVGGIQARWDRAGAELKEAATERGRDAAVRDASVAAQRYMDEH